MEGAAQIGDVLQTTGGWGLAGILMIVVWRLWVANNAANVIKDAASAVKDERIFKLLDKQNEILKILDENEKRRD